MRTMLKITMPTPKSNSAITDGTLAATLKATMERLQPEAAYFFAEDGLRGGLLVFDLNDVSDIPSIVEPLFMGMDANVALVPVMNADELEAGLAKAFPG